MTKYQLTADDRKNWITKWSGKGKYENTVST